MTADVLRTPRTATGECQVAVRPADTYCMQDASPDRRCGSVRRLESTNADFILELAQDGRLLAASATVEELLGWDLARCASDGICAELEDTAQRAAVRQLLAQTLSSGSARTTL